MKVIKSNTYETILKTVEQIYNIVLPTYGKNGKGVLIDNGIEASVLDDGFTVLEELEFEDEAENAVLRFIRETTRKANRRAGDGTTTALILLREILYNLKESLTTQDLEKGREIVVERLREIAVPMNSLEDLQKVAKVSFNNQKIADMVGELVFKTGIDGTISVEESELLESSVEVKQGYFFEKGFVSPYFLNQPNGTSELKTPYVFITQDTISRVATVIPILEHALTGASVLFIGDIEGEALQTILLNKLKKQLNVCVVKGLPNKTFIEDISLITGAKPFSFSEGSETASVDLCGRVDKTIVSENDTTVIGFGGDQDLLAIKIAELKKDLTGGEDYAQTLLKKRIGSLSNGIGILRVGGMTDGERRYTKAKADDAVHATQLALKGVVRGGGMAIAGIDTGVPILNDALQAPLNLIGISYGIYDPVEVVISSIESAVSIASVLFNSEGIIAYKNEK